MCKIVWRSEYERALVHQVPPETLCFCQDGKYKRWEEIRYFIEHQYALLKQNRDGCVLGFRTTDFKHTRCYPLGDDTNVHAMALIVIMKVPLPDKLYNMYVPTTIQQQLQSEALKAATRERRAFYEYEYSRSADEAYKINLLLKLCRLDYGTENEEVRVYPQKRDHPSRSIIKATYPGFLLADGTPIEWKDVPRVVPPDGWVCARCANYFKPVHYVDDCPSHIISAWIPMNHRRAPTGRPKNTLVAVPLTDVTRVATAPFRDAANNLWEEAISFKNPAL